MQKLKLKRFLIIWEKDGKVEKALYDDGKAASQALLHLTQLGHTPTLYQRIGGAS